MDWIEMAKWVGGALAVLAMLVGLIFVALSWFLTHAD
jgi:hypothetical protein